MKGLRLQCLAKLLLQVEHCKLAEVRNALQQKRSAGDISNFYQHLSYYFCLSLLELVSDLKKWHLTYCKIGAVYASPRLKLQIFQCEPSQRQTLQIRIMIQRIYSTIYIYIHNLETSYMVIIVSIYHVNLRPTWMIHVNIGYTTTVHSVDKRMWHTNEIQPRKQTKTLLLHAFPHSKGKGCKGYHDPSTTQPE